VPSPITPREEKGFASINENPESSIHFRRGVNEARTRWRLNDASDPPVRAVAVGVSPVELAPSTRQHGGRS